MVDQATLREVRAKGTTPERLEELARSSDDAVAEAAVGRIVRERLDGLLREALNDPSDPREQAASVMTVMVALLESIPGRMAAFSTEQIDRLFASVFDTRRGVAPVRVAFRSLLDGLLESRGSVVAEVARGLAPGWDGSLLDLLDAAELAVAPPGRTE